MDPLNNINVDKDKPYLYWWVHTNLCFYSFFQCPQYTPIPLIGAVRPSYDAKEKWIALSSFPSF